LPAFATVLKIRSKKLAQTDPSSGNKSISVSSPNYVFFEALGSKFAAISFVRKDLNTDINNAYGSVLFKNQAYYQFNYSILNKFKIVSFFI
jgi:hypothetical protein